jgi:hypothetical protein
MLIFGYDLNIKITNNRFKIIICLILFFLFISFLFLMIGIFICFSYFVFKLFKSNIEDNNIFYYNYSKKSKNTLDLYGDYKINKLYLVKQNVGDVTKKLLNFFTLYKYDKTINDVENSLLYHILIIVEIQLPNNKNKLLLLEKNNCINLCEKCNIHNFHNIKKLNIKNKNYTLKQIMNDTKNRIGNKKFFNWSMFKNNCKKFVKEILITIKKYNKLNKKFVFQRNDLKEINVTDFATHSANSLMFIYNLFYKYIYEGEILESIINMKNNKIDFK